MFKIRELPVAWKCGVKDGRKLKNPDYISSDQDRKKVEGLEQFLRDVNAPKQNS
ncbi:3667_t:CDS:2 [Entrophospora sp. SA101]|nr:8134_t:CDS:2 [Entrophospora sp. SA101]CAJ0908041.1 3667_t:CDS:2 [Entrophospora sp. SA101]